MCSFQDNRNKVESKYVKNCPDFHQEVPREQSMSHMLVIIFDHFFFICW